MSTRLWTEHQEICICMDAIKKRKQGMSPDDIARHFLIALSTLYQWLNRHDMRQEWKDARLRVPDKESKVLRKCIRLHAQGHKIDEIARTTGKTESWIYYNMQKVGYEPAAKNYTPLTNTQLHDLLYVEKLNYKEIGKLYDIDRQTVSALAARYGFESEYARKRREMREQREASNDRP